MEHITTSSVSFLTDSIGGKSDPSCYATGVDVILDNIGGPYFQRNLNSLNFDGRLFIIGFMGGTITEVNLSGLLARRLTVQGMCRRLFRFLILEYV